MTEAVSDSDVERSPDATLAAPTFEEFVANRSKTLWRAAWLLTGDEHKAEDLVQAALVKVGGTGRASLATGPSTGTRVERS
jgi:DNA-directed RNA polymerase specialized sigma24 family protein